MVFIIIGMATFLFSLFACVAAFFVGVTSGLTATQVSLVMLLSLVGMAQGAFVATYGSK